ncbi:hypothetical protein LOK49_LG11G00531 [Camellia lanceoleosa]|uniref:Uncharacterized protein n=1 Tax=Camellia lanceoleosa TaxID=1840588 RepID=A0ACC0G432_9ERIC|nr:hypothetical protein LOK49_LG11G00531 [Camellia lanceoleosa]
MVVAESSLEANDDNLRVEEQLCTPSYIQCLHGSAGHRLGISLTVNLSHLHNLVENNRSGIVVRGPNPHLTSTSNWAFIRPNIYKVQTNPNGFKDGIPNVLKSKKKALSLSTSMEGSFSTRSHILSETQGNIQLGKIQGINYKGKEAEVLEKMEDLELVDRARRKEKRKE